MCGICGVFGKTDDATIERMCSVMVHRGPDESGAFVDEHAAIGSRRLSIIDVAGGRQPISNEDKSVWLVCNGEIYNYLDLRRDLESRGHAFKTHSDCEVIVHLYEDHGVDCLDKLRGMFGLAIWDSRKRRMFIARDRLGIKPLYYTERNGSLIFGSEIKAILEHPDVSREVDPVAMDAYLTLEYVPGPRTMFRGMQKLPPGHYAVKDASGLQVAQYWDLCFDQGDRTEAQALTELEQLLDECVESHLISDVPLGALLSGGIDSATVVGLISRHSSLPVKTFTVGFDVGGGFNELKYAAVVARLYKTDHHELIASVEDVELLPKLIWHMDEPVADRAALPTYLVCMLARESVKVVLTGEGSDEFFGGYPRYAWFMLAKKLERVLPAALRSACVAAARAMGGGHTTFARRAEQLLGAMPDVDRHLAWISNHSPADKQSLYNDSFKAQVGDGMLPELIGRYLDTNDDLHALMYLDARTWLVDNVLVKMDKMSMAASLEARVPFLDHHLVEFAASLPPELKVRGMTTKYLLKKLSGKLLPPEIVHRKKHPFDVPVAQWLRGRMRPMAEEALISDDSPLSSYFDKTYLRWMLEEHCEGRRDFNRRIWNLMCLSYWHRAFLGR